VNRILVACIGNIFLADDGFGVEVAQQLGRLALPDGVEVVDFGIRGFDLAYSLLDGWEVVVMVDAISRSSPPGTLFLLEPGGNEMSEWRPVEGHGMDPVEVLRLVVQMGGTLPPLFVVGCEPADLGGEDGSIGLTPAVAAAVPEAIQMVSGLVSRLAGATAIPAAAGSHLDA
jgi:hydrogenase maturation protease